MNIYVGNLSRETAEGELRTAFEVFGTVTRASIITDKITHQSKGFGFIDMTDETQAKAAIVGMTGKEMHGRTLNVNEAHRLSETRKPAESSQPDSGYRGGRRDSF